MSWFNFLRRKKNYLYKKISPTQVIESVWFPWLESGFVKYPQEEIAQSDKKRRFSGVKIVNPPLGKKELSSWNIHTHRYPFGNTVPSPSDFFSFLTKPKLKTMVIAQRHILTGDVRGYLVIRKTKKTPPIQYSIASLGLHLSFLSSPSIKSYMKDTCKNFSLQYKIIPVKGYVFDESRFNFIKEKESSLENKVAKAVSLVSLPSGTVLLSPNITGNAVANLSQTSSNWIGGILIIIGFIAGFFWFRSRE